MQPGKSLFSVQRWIINRLDGELGSFFAVERGLMELRELGIEQQLWEASRREIATDNSAAVTANHKSATVSEVSSWWIRSGGIPPLHKWLFLHLFRPFSFLILLWEIDLNYIVYYRFLIFHFFPTLIGPFAELPASIFLVQLGDRTWGHIM